MAIQLNRLLLFVVLIALLQRTLCQVYSSQQGDEESPFPGDGGYPGPGPGGPGAGGGGMYPPSGPGGLHPGAVVPGPGSPPFGREGQEPRPPPSFQEGGEEGGGPPSDFDPNLDIPSMPGLMGEPEWPGMGTGVDSDDWPQPPNHISSDGSLYSPPSDLGPSIHEGTHQDSIGDHNGAAETGENDPKGGTNSELMTGEQESVKSHSMRHNMTASGTPDDDFNYVGMYVTVGICIAFMVTLVAIALIRGPQGPFKTKRTDEEIARGLNLNGGQTAGDVILLSDGAAIPTDAQWEQQPLRGDCDDVVTDVQVSCGDTAVASENSTTVAVTEITSKEEGV
ncbi:collagen alpha-1(XVII) chain isoform X2 [Strongylocentrotus purpuratus]|uniref:Uncharacterized protein n=1 Tax=Strongylocentrotus purpuratus TaxID=7668 RepID=A0A7M7HK28_STRPU|nr:collagen alpha-1(XVII) chain isoform X2 [Strongylocentrotus purpuratus]